MSPLQMYAADGEALSKLYNLSLISNDNYSTMHKTLKDQLLKDLVEAGFVENKVVR